MRVSVIVVNYHHEKVISRALRSLSSLGGDLVEVLVVDNAGDLGSAVVPTVCSLSPEMLVPGRNLGFAAAVNLAVERARGDHLMMLSPDAEIVAWDSDRLVHELAPPTGAVGALTVDHCGRPAVSWGDFPGVRRFFRRTTGLESRGDRAILHRLERCESQRVPWLLGAAVVIRREVFARVGGLDAHFFASGDDQDLGARLRRQGLHNVVSSAWVVRHEPRDPVSIKAEIAANDRRYVAAYGSCVDRFFWRLAGHFGNTVKVGDPGDAS